MPAGGANNAFSMTVSPAKVAESHKTVTLWNTGHSALTAHTEPLLITRVHGVCKVTGMAPWAHITPRWVTLKPGEHKAAQVHLGHIPAGKHDLAIAFIQQAHGTGQVKLQGAVAAQMLAIGQGHVAHPVKPCVAISAPQAHGFNVLLILPWLLVIFAAMGIAGAFLRHRRHHRGTRADGSRSDGRYDGPSTHR